MPLTTGTRQDSCSVGGCIVLVVLETGPSSHRDAAGRVCTWRSFVNKEVLVDIV